MIEAKYTLSEETLLEGFELHFQYKRPFLKYYPYLGILVLLIAAVTFNRFDNKVFVPALLMGLMFLGTPFLVRFLNRKSIKRLPTLGHETFWQFDANNISATTQEGDFSQEWANMKDALITPHGVLIYQRNNIFYWLPKSAFASATDFQQVHRFIADSVPKHKVLEA